MENPTTSDSNLPPTPTVETNPETATPTNQATPPTSTRPFYKQPLFIFAFFAIDLLIIGGVLYYFFIRGTSPNPQPTLPAPSPVPTITESQPSITPADNASISAELTKTHNQFGIDLFKYLNQNTEQPNIMISPTSIPLAFNLALNGAAEETYDQIQQLFYPAEYTNQQINQSTQELIQFLENPDENVELAIANSIWTNDQYQFLPDFLDTNQQFLKAEARALDFADPESIDTINDWVSTQTQEKIPTILNDIPPDAIAYLINAIYFKGIWTTQFDPEQTQDQDFTNRDQSVASVPTMQLKQDNFKYTQTDEDLQIIELPYGPNQRLSMTVYLPAEDQTLDQLINQLTLEQLQTWQQSLTPQEGTILLPRFKSEYENNQLALQLPALGLTAPFSPSGANFSRMIDLDQMPFNLYVNQVIHKTFIEVNEEGTEAAAVTSIGVFRTTAIQEAQPFYMHVNRPFLYSIQDTQSGAILFLGTITQL